MKYIPLNRENKPMYSLKHTRKNAEQSRSHMGNFGLATGTNTNIIAIEVTQPQLNFFEIIISETCHGKPAIICEDWIGPDQVIAMAKPGYIMYAADSITFSEINFEDFLLGIKVLGNNRYVLAPNTTTNTGIMLLDGDLENIPGITGDDFARMYKHMDQQTNKQRKFYVRHEWIEFYKKYCPDLEQVTDNIYASPKRQFAVHRNGMYRHGKTIGWPLKFLEKELKIKNRNQVIKRYCGESLIYADKHIIIIERDDGYHIEKYKTQKHITNWFAEDVHIQETENGLNLTIFPKDHKPIVVTWRDLSSMYLLRKRFSRYGLFIFIKSEPAIYALIHGLIESASSKKTVSQKDLMEDWDRE